LGLPGVWCAKGRFRVDRGLNGDTSDAETINTDNIAPILRETR
jgi:hypothetical protein